MDLTIVLHTAFVLSTNVAADAAPAVQVGAGFRRDWFSLDLEARGVLPGVTYAREPVDPAKPIEPQDFDVSQLSLLAVPCVRFATYFAGCIAAQGALHITQTRAPETSLLPAFYAGPRFAVEIPFAERFAVFGFVEVLFGSGQGLAIIGVGPNGEPSQNAGWRPPAVSGFFGAGLSVKFQ